jgi:hypothetical protein
MRSSLLLPFFLLFLCNTVLSQQPADTKISGDFDNVKLAEFFRRLEQQASYKFYYDISQLDSFVLRLNVREQTLSQVLQEAFKGTDIRFSIDNNGRNVYITKGLTIITELPKDLFARNNGMTTGNAVVHDSLADYDIDAKKITRAEKLVEIGNKADAKRGVVTITGFIRNSKTGEPVTNASVYVDSNYAATTDMDGRYTVNVPTGSHVLGVTLVGMKDTRLRMSVYSRGKLDIDMDEQVQTLKEVVVSSNRVVNIKSVQMGVQRLTIENIRRIPTVFGEADVLRAIVSLPGVKTVGEASTGFNVRGGSADQNLILFNDATIYNPSHFFGLFSAFNPDVIKDIELYKSSVPAKYGGRLSSVLDISGREGNKKEITGSAGIGLVTSRFHIEGPLAKNKTSFILGGRTTYANWLLNLLPSEYKNSRASFQDVNLIIHHRIDSNNHIYFSGYFSNDRFSLASDTTYGYSNRNLSLKWRHQFNRKFSSILIAGFDQYLYNVSSDENKVNAFRLGFDINQFNLRADFEYFMNSKHSFDFGVSSIRYKLHPGFFDPLGSQSAVSPDEVQAEQAIESGAYFTHRFNPTPKLSFSTGLRYSLFNYLGPQEVRIYTPGQPITPTNLSGTKEYDKGKMIQTYGGPEYRVSVRYAFSNTFSIKAAFNSLRQYIHLLSNTAIIAPTDIWKLSDVNIKPQKGAQLSFGIYNNFRSNTIETSIEAYYKKITDYLDYKPGASLFLNHSIETEVINTRGKAYGIEVLIKKTVGKLTGWISYTYSRILLQASDTTQGVLVNKGNYYPANYDKPHDVTLTGNFKLNHRFSVSLNSTYSTGRPITLPIGRYYYAGSQRVLYSDRNAHRIPDYFRTDFSMNIEGNHKIKQKTHNSWTIGVYNLLGRKNPYSVYYVSEGGLVHGYKLSIFGSIIPFVNFNVNF